MQSGTTPAETPEQRELARRHRAQRQEEERLRHIESARTERERFAALGDALQVEHCTSILQEAGDPRADDVPALQPPPEPEDWSGVPIMGGVGSNVPHDPKMGVDPPVRPQQFPAKDRAVIVDPINGPGF